METKIRLSYGTAIVLGLLKAKQDVAPTTAYLLYDRGCIGSCSFCSRANGNSQSKKLSRIVWPEFQLDDVIERLKQKPAPFKRVCLQTGYNPSTDNELKSIIKILVDTGLTISSTISPSQVNLALELLNLGLDHVGIGLDAATEKSYAEHKHKVWKDDWPELMRLLEAAKGKVEVHLIYGLGDNEENFMKCVQNIVKAGGRISLFAFTPVNGGTPPDISSYRRVQAFRYLCENGHVSFNDCLFKNGRLISFNISDGQLKKALDNGNAFRTSGCNNCNRPYYNERPGQAFFNYPRALFTPEFEQAIKQMELFSSTPSTNL